MAIVILVKAPEAKAKARVGRKLGVLRYADGWGVRKAKYEWLQKHQARTTEWTKLILSAPNFYFVPKNTNGEDEYRSGISIREMFIVSGNAIKTERDKLTVRFTRKEMQQVVEDFHCETESELRSKYKLGEDSRDWSIERAQSDIKAHKSGSLFRTILYRPFDLRHTWYSGVSKGFIGTPASGLMKHFMSGENIGLCAMRQSRRGEPGPFFVTDGLVNKDIVSPYDIGSVFPLYLYPNGEKEGETESLIIREDPPRRANLSPGFTAEFSAKLKLRFLADGAGDLKKTFGPEDVFHYTYAVFHSPGYRARYAEFLRMDFPRLPLTENVALFRQLAVHGAELVALHLLRKYGPHAPTYPIAGTHLVEAVRYIAPGDPSPVASEGRVARGRVYFNAQQYFDDVPPEAWTFSIGGYRPAEKWLKDRKGRVLSYEEQTHYPRLIAALAETRHRMVSVDAAIEAAGGWPLR